MTRYIITTALGERGWWADDEAHAIEQHVDAFGTDEDEEILSVREDNAVTRTAIIETPRDALTTVQRYLPSNYTAYQADNGSIYIIGEDNAGWTMDGYVLPRLASGMIYAREIDA